MAADEEIPSGLNLAGLDLDNLDIDQLVSNNRDFLDCPLENILKYNLQNLGMNPYLDLGSYKRIDLIQSSILKMLEMIREISSAPDVVESYVQFLVEQVNNYLSITSNFSAANKFLNKRSFLSIHVRTTSRDDTHIPYAAMYSPLSTFSTPSSPVSNPATTPISSLSSLAPLSPPTPASSLSSRSLVRHDSMVGVEVVNLVLKNTPTRRRRVEVAAVEEVTLMLGKKKDEKEIGAKRILQVREREEVSLQLGRKKGGMLKSIQEDVISPEINLSVEVVEVEEVSINLEITKKKDELSIEIQHEDVEEVTLSLAGGETNVSFEFSEWKVMNVNKYGSVMMVYAADPLSLRVKFQGNKSEEWDGDDPDERHKSSFFANVEVVKKNFTDTYNLESRVGENSTKMLPHTTTFAFERHERGINFILITIFHHSVGVKELVCCTLVPVVVI